MYIALINTMPQPYIIIAKDGESLLQMEDINGQMTLVVTSGREISGALSPDHNLYHQAMRALAEAVLQGTTPATDFLKQIFNNDAYMLEFLTNHGVLSNDSGVLLMSILVQP